MSKKTADKQEYWKYNYNPDTLLYEVERVPKWRMYLKRTLKIAGALGLGVFYIWIYVSVFGLELPKTAILRKENTEWIGRMDILNRLLDLYEETLSGIEERDDHVYRSIFGLNEIPEDVKKAGFGGVDRYAYIDELGGAPLLKNTLVRMDVMTKRTYLQTKALDEVGLISKTAGDMVSCVPAVIPISPLKGSYHISSSFGYRRDPVYGGRRFHEGVDFASPIGNPIYVTGDGVVESVRYQFYGYGNTVVVDHGFGYKTRYAHMNSVDVAVGMRLKRGDKLGEVGKTGKSTGPHLHYEVIYKGKPVNPMHYLDTNISIEEFMAMVDRGEEHSSSRRKVPSNSELLRRRR